MTKPRTIGNMVAPWRFIMFVLVGVATLFPAIPWFGSSLGIMVAFDLAAAMFLISCINLLNIDDPIVIERLAKKNDAARTFLLVITLLVIAVLLKAVAAETVAGRPEPATKALIIMTLVIAWLFSNMVYALHYAHMAYIQPPGGCAGIQIPRNGRADLLGLRLFCLHLRNGIRDG